MKRTHDYDNVFKTMKHRHKRLFISVINETFGKNYPLDSEIEVLPSEGYLTEEETQIGEKNIEEQISDFLIKIGNDVFLLECQSYDDDSMAIRIAEYAFITARNKKNTYPQYLLVADLFGLDLGIDFYAGETLGVTDSNTIRISNWCTGKRPIPLDIVQENDADDFESMAERFSENICPNILNISHARSETEKLIKENVMVLGEEMANAMTLIEDNSDFFTSVIRYGISNSHSQGTFFSPDLADTLLNCHAPKPVMTFAGRDTEAKEVYKMLSKDSVLFVSGIAGIGKSEFVKYFAEKYAKKYTNIIYWFYSGNLKQNITEMDFISDRMAMADAEVVKLALKWAFDHPEVEAVEAESDPDNAASQRVLKKCA